jgi:hypothetical protein
MSKKKFLPLITDDDVANTSKEMQMPINKELLAQLHAQQELDNIKRISDMKRQLVDLEEAQRYKDLKSVKDLEEVQCHKDLTNKKDDL